jgi:hypothetical protein
MNWLVVVPVVAAKFLLPVALIWFPFAAGWANFVLDTIDGDLLIPAGLGNSSDPNENHLYQNLDKIADYTTYVFMVIAAWKWPVRKWIIALFAVRTVGQTLFFVTQNELMLLFFPNFLEPLFLVCATLLFFKRAAAWDHLMRYRFVYGPAIFIYKMQDEVLTHLVDFDRSEAIGRLFGG